MFKFIALLPLDNNLRHDIFLFRCTLYASLRNVRLEAFENFNFHVGMHEARKFQRLRLGNENLLFVRLEHHETKITLLSGQTFLYAGDRFFI